MIRVVAFMLLALVLPPHVLQPVHAYERMNYRWADTSVTYACDSPSSSSTGLARAVRAWADVSGLEDGGCVTEAPDIEVVVLEPWLFGSGALAAAGVSETIGQGEDGVFLASRCTVYVPRSGSIPYGVWLHEVGHCNGLGHSQEPDAAMYYLCCNPLGADDLAGIRDIYGPEAQAVPGRHEVVIPLVSKSD